MRRWLWAFLGSASLALLVVGLSRGEWATVLGWANTLCTSCIGLGR